MKKLIEILTTVNVLHKNDLVVFPNNQRLIVLESDGNGLTLYPFPIRAHWVIAAVYFFWIKIRYRFVKLWRWIKTPQ